MTPKIIVTSGVPRGYMEPEEPKCTCTKNFEDPDCAVRTIEWEAAKAAAIAEAKEFEDPERVIALLVKSLPPDETKLFFHKGGVTGDRTEIAFKKKTYDSPVGWVEVRQMRAPDGNTGWILASLGEWFNRDPKFEYRTILRLVEKENLSEKEECIDCKGKGYTGFGHEQSDACATCHGTGYIEYPADLGAGQENQPDETQAKLESLQAENERLKEQNKSTIEMWEKDSAQILALQSKLDKVRDYCERNVYPNSEILELLK